MEYIRQVTRIWQAESKDDPLIKALRKTVSQQNYEVLS